ncbi:MAG: hypothetical protein ACK5CE_15920 [Actinomycetes bacterium]|nr:hypothetical protein [Actinomycetota bacterium]
MRAAAGAKRRRRLLGVRTMRAGRGEAARQRIGRETTAPEAEQVSE